jgi:WD40 repeat protein
MLGTRRGRSQAKSAGKPVVASPATAVKADKAEAEEGGMSDYEAARLRNIASNREMLEKLGIESAASSIRAKEAQAKAFAKPAKRVREQRDPIRRSTRGKDADGQPIAPLPAVEEPVVEHVAPSGPVDMRPDGADFAVSLMDLTSTQKVAADKAKPFAFSSLTLGEDTCCAFARLAPRVKVVKERIFSMAFHPSPHIPLVVAGDKWGQIGFLDLRPDKQQDERVCALFPHGRPVSALAHSGDGQKLYSSSYDGTVRCFDYGTGIFELLWKNDEEMLSHLALARDDNRLYLAGNRGDLYLLDPRAAAKPSQELDLHDRKISTVDGHPSDSNIFATASNDQTVKVWDCRRIAKAKPLHLLEHTLAVTAAYYAAAAPHTLVTTCNDNLVRFWSPKAQAKESQVVKVKHNNNTGRYITNFRAVWDPTSSAVLIGNMNKKVDFLAPDGKELASISHELCSAIPAINVAHASLALVASGNGSGYVNVWGPAS